MAQLSEVKFVKDLVDGIRDRNYSDLSATVIVGVSIGVSISATMLCFCLLIRQACVPFWDLHTVDAKIDSTKEQEIEDNGNQDDEESSVPASLPSHPKVPEGGYRSESESSDDGETEQAIKIARKRSRHTNGI